MLQAGSVLAPMRRGAQGRSGHAARRCPAPPDLRHLRRLLATLARVIVWLVSQPGGADPRSAVLARPSAITRPGPQLAERARRAKPDPQHGLASIQRDLSHGWVVLGSLCVDERLHPAEVCGTSHVRRAVHRGQVHRSQQAGRSATGRLADEVHDVHGVPSGHDGGELRQPRIDIAAEKLRPGRG